MKPLEALNMLYNASRKLNVDADVHDKLKEFAIIIEKALKEAEQKSASYTDPLS